MILLRCQKSRISSDESFLNDLRQAIISSTLLMDFYLGKLDKSYDLIDGLLYFNGLLVIPSESLQLRVFMQRHCSPAAGHYGMAKTLELITRDFHWPNLRKSIRRLIRNCDVCQRSKPSRHAPYGLLQALSVPSERWWDISMDFITVLPISNGYDSIFVVKDRLSKQAHFIPCKKTITGEETAELFLREIFRLHGSPRSIVSDRGTQFVSTYWKRFSELLGTKVNLSSAFHPETDGSTEVLNQMIEQYLRIYCNYQQDDWTTHISLAEFTYNNTVNTSTQMTPFFANHGHHPLFDLSVIRESVVPSAESRILQLKTIREDLIANLTSAQESYTHYANRSRLPTPDLRIGDLVYLDRRHIKTSRPSSKLDYKKLGPFKISHIINPVTFKLKLPPSMKIHPVFHVSLLEPKTRDIIQDFIQPPPPPEIIDSYEEFEVEEILDSRLHRGKLQYFIHWKGYPVSDRTWEPASNVINSPKLLMEFHQRYPDKPKPTLGVRHKRRG